MAYTPDPTDVTQPVESVFAKTAAAEFRALKQYIQSIVSGGGPGAIPPGSIWEFPLLNVPAGFLLADGSLKSRTAFANLFAVANTDGLVTEVDWANGNWGCFGAGDGVTTFRLPDLRGEFRRGSNSGRGLPGVPNVRGVFSDGTRIRTVVQEWAGTDTTGGPFHIGITTTNGDEFVNLGGGYPAGALSGAGVPPAASTADNAQDALAVNAAEGVAVNNWIKMRPRGVTTLVCIKT